MASDRDQLLSMGFDAARVDCKLTSAIFCSMLLPLPNHAYIF